jgi:hypothetical protein
MTAELEDRLRTDMERFTRDVCVPRGLAMQAYRHNRQRRARLRVAIAAGAATALAASAVAAAGVSGAFGSAPVAPAPPPARTTAYVLRHVESALAPSNIDNLISLNRLVLPSATTLEPVSGGLSGGAAAGGAGSPWTVAELLHWAYQGTQKYSAYGPNGQHVFDMGISYANGSVTETVVVYANRTWWTATKTAAGPRSSGCVTNSIQLTAGPGSGWPAFIRSQLSCGAYTVVGHQVVNGIDAIKITGSLGQLTLLVNPATYLPIQLTIGPLQNYFQWLRPIPANLAQLKQSVPAGFRQVPPPAQK